MYFRQISVLCFHGYLLIFSDICVVFLSVYEVVFCKFAQLSSTVYCVSYICFVFYIFTVYRYVLHICVVFCMFVL